MDGHFTINRHGRGILFYGGGYEAGSGQERLSHFLLRRSGAFTPENLRNMTFKSVDFGIIILRLSRA